MFHVKVLRVQLPEPHGLRFQKLKFYWSDFFEWEILIWWRKKSYIWYDWKIHLCGQNEKRKNLLFNEFDINILYCSFAKFILIKWVATYSRLKKWISYLEHKILIQQNDFQLIQLMIPLVFKIEFRPKFHTVSGTI